MREWRKFKRACLDVESTARDVVFALENCDAEGYDAAVIRWVEALERFEAASIANYSRAQRNTRRMYVGAITVNVVVLTWGWYQLHWWPMTIAAVGIVLLTAQRRKFLRRFPP